MSSLSDLIAERLIVCEAGSQRSPSGLGKREDAFDRELEQWSKDRKTAEDASRKQRSGELEALRTAVEWLEPLAEATHTEMGRDAKRTLDTIRAKLENQ